MDIQFIDQVVNLLQKALELAQKLYRALQEGGPPPFSLLPEKAAIDRTTVHRKPADLFGLWDDEAIRREYLRMQTRNRVRRWRERERRKMNAVTEAGVTSNASVTDRNAEAVTYNASVTECNAEAVTGNAAVTECNAPETATYETAQRPMESLFPAYDETTGVNECNAETVTCNASVTHCNAETVTGNAAAKKEKENEKRKKQRKELKKNKKTKTNIADAMPTSAREGIAASVTEMEKCNDGNVMAAATQKSETGNENNTAEASRPQQKNAELIPTEKLPEAYRKVVLAWNQLPLEIKLSGLYPRLVKRLRNLFENYGEDQIHKAIESIANSPFLLGKSKNNRGWVVNFSWLTDPENLEKILEGQYLDKAANNWGARLFQQGDELLPLPEGFIGTVVY